MKKLYLMLLMSLILFIPTSVNAVAVYQLDQPIKELDNYTLREIFENRNQGMPDLDGKVEISVGVHRLYESSGITYDYEIKGGIHTINGTATSNIGYTLFSLLSDSQYTASYIAISGTLSGGSLVLFASSPSVIVVLQSNQNINKQNTFITTTQTMFRFSIDAGRTFDNYTFKLQLERGSQATPYQVPTNGPYSDIDVGQFGLTQEQIQTYYNLYLEAVRFEQENEEARQDLGGYQNIFRSIINGVKGLITEMGFVWQWLNAPIITSDMQDFNFIDSIDWSWDLIGVVRQILNSIGILVLQITFWVPSLAFAFMGIPVQVSILSLLFSNLIFLLLGWIMVKSFII